MAGTLPIWIQDNPGLHGLILSIRPHSMPEEAAAYGLSLALVGWLALYWRGAWQPGSARFAAGYAMLPVVDLLAAPYAHSDDLAVLVVPAVVLCALAVRHAERDRVASVIPAVLTALYLAPVVVVYLRQHVMAPALLWALWALWRAGRAD